MSALRIENYDRRFDRALELLKEKGSPEILKYTRRKDGISYEMVAVVNDFFQIRGADYVWVEKDAIPKNFRSLHKENIEYLLIDDEEIKKELGGS